MNVEPSPGIDRTWSSPPSNLAISRLIESPKPVPPYLRLVVPSAWVAGSRKVHHWRTLVTARAIENVSYVAAVGQSAPRYTGHSMIVDPRGDVVAEAGDHYEIVVGQLAAGLLEEARTENPSLLNRRDDTPF